MISNKTIRLRTTPGESKNIQVKIEQEFDTLDVLSLKITQEEAYRNFCSDYGVIVGRVIANDGFGVENAKISVFIPVSNEDLNDPKISTLYPFSTVVSKDTQGVRYNLLPKQGKTSYFYQRFPQGYNPNSDTGSNFNTINGGNFVGSWIQETTTYEDGTILWKRLVDYGYGPKTPTGTFPSKQEFLDNDTLLEIYEKYYKLTTKTNVSGDYMLFGVPVGNQTLHMDVDLSDAGQATLTVDDFLNAGFPQQLFDATNSQFLSSTNLDSLPQIESRNVSVEVVPFWGNLDQCEVGITRLDFNLNKTVTPSSILIFQAFTNIEGYIKRSGGLDSCNIGDTNGEEFSAIENMTPLDVSVKYQSVTSSNVETELSIKEFNFSDGKVFISLPMYSGKKITDEFGNTVDSPDGEKGIPTEGRYRIDYWGTNTHQKYLDGVDNNYNTAAHSTIATFRYDLISKKRSIYTVGNQNWGEECVGSCDKKWIAIRGHQNGGKLPYPINFTRADGKKNFGMGRVCYGSLYFPKFQVKSNGNDETEYYCNVLTVYGAGDGTQPYRGFVYLNTAINARNIMDITEILYLFKPFGGQINSTSSIHGLNYYSQVPILITNAATNSMTPAGVNLIDHSIPLRNDSLGINNPVLPKKLNTRQITSTLYPTQVLDTSSLLGPDYKISQVSWYFFYFGLDSSNNSLTNLKQKLGE